MTPFSLSLKFLTNSCFRKTSKCCTLFPKGLHIERYSVVLHLDKHLKQNNQNKQKDIKILRFKILISQITDQTNKYGEFEGLTPKFGRS